MLVLCALSPLAAALLLELRDQRGTLPASVLWPQWELGSQVLDPVAICAALAYVGAAWFFERMVWSAPALRGFHAVWVPLLTGGAILFFMKQLITGFAGIIGIALAMRAFDYRREEMRKRESSLP